MTVDAWKNGSVTHHEADLLVPIASEGSIMIQLRGDLRKISEIAADFEGIDELSADDGRSWTEYTEPIVVYRMNEDTVQVRIRRHDN